jgi:site-specific recombinase XerD
MNVAAPNSRDSNESPVSPLMVRGRCSALCIERYVELTHARTSANLKELQTFFRYVAAREPTLASLCHPVFAIPTKKALRPLLGYFSEQGVGHLLTQIDRSGVHGERDYILLAVLYDTGARIQEVLDLTPRHFHFDVPAYVRV